jgi:ribosomal protein S18 acetylase RimI-like enzyme
MHPCPLRLPSGRGLIGVRERVSTFTANLRMFDAMDYVIRPLTAADEPILWEMLYQALQTGESETALSRDIVRQPEFARYVEGWGRAGDAGFVAHDVENGQLVGAVWFRSPTGDATPELAFAVKPGHRKHGIGAALLTQWVRANPEQSEISLRVAANNPSVRLYERFGFKVVRQNDKSVTLRREV